MAGVPPDYFSATGQLWGNPLYRWDVMQLDGYAWLVERLRSTLGMVDVVRIDHFRGLEAYYEIPGRGGRRAGRAAGRRDRATALLVGSARDAGALPFIAEDLGIITAEVARPARRFSASPACACCSSPSATSDGPDPFKPHNYVAATPWPTPARTTTTPPSAGSAGRPGADTERRAGSRGSGSAPSGTSHSDGREIHWDFIRAIEASVARTAVVPLQDVLGLGSEARFNRPASPNGNWTWRFEESQLEPAARGRASRRWPLCYGR